MNPLKTKPTTALFFLIMCSLCCNNAWAKAPVSYHLEVTDAAQHLAAVKITFPAVATKTLQLKLPVWRSGRYEILDLSKNILNFAASHTNGQTIQWDKTDKNTWKLWLNQPGDITVTYEVYANMLKYRVAHIDETHAYLDASGVFMYAPTYRQQALTVGLTVPEPWQSRSGLTATGDHQFTAKDYDQLVDSPIESGIHEFQAFQVDNRQYEILIWGQGNHDIDDLQQQVTAMHHAAQDIWGDYPFDRYLYMYHVGDGLRGATEHVNSTIIQQDRFNFAPREKYLKVLATTAHEFVHTWNVKAYRPAGIAPYDYSVENYSDLFWMAEGITSYYDDLLLLRSGIYTAEEYYERLAANIHQHLNKPGRLRQSVAATSWDTWLKRDPQLSHNDSVSIYLEGSLVAWRLDQEMRALTNNRVNLDDLQRALYEKHHNIDKGYRKQDVLSLLEELTGQDMQDFWSAYVEGTTAIDFSALLDFYGLKMAPKEDEEALKTVWVGAQFEFKPNQVLVKTVDRDSPAWQAGLTAGDQLLAINGIQAKEKNLEALMQTLTADEPQTIDFFTGGQLKTSQLTPTSPPYPEFDVVAVEKPSEQQRIHHHSWTGMALDEAD